MDVEIHTTSAFSFLRGASLPEDLVQRAAELGYGAVALLDHDGLYGAPRFYRAAREAGVHAIVGAVVGVVASGVCGRIGLYVRSQQGYRHLCRLITNARLRTTKQHARDRGIWIPIEELAEYNDGLAVLFLPGETPLATIPAGQSPALAWVRAVVGVFGSDRCFLEQGRHFRRDEARMSVRHRQLAEAMGLRIVASNDVRYATPASAPVADVFACMRARTTLESAGTLLDANAERYLKPPGELRELFRDTPRWLDNARALAESCAFTLKDLGYRFPEYPVPPGETPQSYLRHLVHLGARDRYRPLTARALEQIRHELEVIEKLDLAGYFLVVWDIVRFCREQGILVQGRGSAANSAVCYALGITAVDPVGMDLLFERFLSEERGEWPDIDLDLPSGERRERVIQYVYERYGERGAAMTANVITYRARSAVRECGKIMGYPDDVLDKVCRQLSWTTLDCEQLAKCISEAGLCPRDARVARWIETAWRMQNLPRHLGQHPGGMVISAGRLDEICPLEPASMPGRVVIQWDKDDCNDLGILKVDLLGLGMMALLQEAIPLIRAYDGVDIDLAHLPHDDPETYAMLQRADTVGVFQVESRAQMATLPRMKPERFYDLVVQVALIRPGPLVGKMVHPYLARRAGRAPVVYPHPALEPILARTLGVPLFQEQLMRMAMVAAGFTGAQAEELRRALGSKRSAERMKAIEQQLRAGMTANGYPPEAQEEVIQGIRSFAQYGFPESHSASFALLAYASAYLKCHYPAAFTCALLNQWPMGFYHPATVVKDAQRHGVRVLPIDVTRSEWNCTCEPDDRPGGRGAVRLGLRYVRGLRQQVADAIERERALRPFTSIDDFARRTGAREAELSALAELGALARLPRRGGEAPWSRRSALWQVKNIAAQPPGRLFATTETPEDPSPLEEMSLAERIAADYRNSGLTVGPHPMALRRHELDARGVVRISRLSDLSDGAPVSVAGAVIVRQRPPTAKGFFFLTLEDETGIANAIVSPALFERERATMISAPWLLLHGTVQHQDGVTHVRVSHAEPLVPDTLTSDTGTEVAAVALPDARDFR